MLLRITTTREVESGICYDWIHRAFEAETNMTITVDLHDGNGVETYNVA